MKNLFVCEKCGKMSDDCEVIAKCERMHYTVHRGWYPDDKLVETMDSMTEYKEGQEEPNIIHILFERSYWDEDSGEWKDEKRCGKYKLVASYDMPTVISNE